MFQPLLKRFQKQVLTTSLIGFSLFGPAASADQASEQIRATIEQNGLAQTLSLLAAQMQTPVRINEAMVLNKVKADGKTFERHYRATQSGINLPAGWRKTTRQGVCGNPPLRELLKAGATFVEVYKGESADDLLGKVSVRGKDCT